MKQCCAGVKLRMETDPLPGKAFVIYIVIKQVMCSRHKNYYIFIK